MTFRNLASAFGLTLALSGCAENHESFLSTPSLIFQDNHNPFNGKRVKIFYATNDGPRADSGNKLYVPSRALDPECLDIVERELLGKGAYTSLGGVFRARYSEAAALALSSRNRTIDYIVIADKNPNFAGTGISRENLDRVYLAVPDGQRYKFKKAGDK